MRVEVKWNKSKKEFETDMNQMKIRDARKFINNIDNDPKKEKREKEQVCKVCSYTSYAALSAMTYANCGFCNNETLFPNSNVDKLCQRCAIMHGACKKCGGEMD